MVYAIKMIFFVLFLWFCSNAIAGGIYIDAGLYYDPTPMEIHGDITWNDKRYNDISFESSNAVFEASIRYEIGNSPFSIELKHVSDPLRFGEEDLISNNYAGIKASFKLID